ncbi:MULTISPECIES: bifunctional transcriptional activator/DNA repair enzyme AdaA [Paenibacillus]|uniref:AraC family transcriptional regulator n=1 Tax=Paenibacillus campinasensis TaxID=66347 RepID=A0A268ETZ6_9BACL|nr:bifunctional transcriptional activator/DNA repair enzyme AdaA [Paenibacillus campinasensis]PAD76598.1 AraC family transcriptional regulator [Paenibacillus campinasensis]
MATGSRPAEEQWNAIIRCDSDYDGQFFYAVQSTGIFCRPSCKSRPPKREHVRIFATCTEAIDGNFRPCKRCKPADVHSPDQEWIQRITDYIHRHCHEALTLDVLATVSHGSPYHLHRTFKRIQGRTPLEYIQDVRMDRARQLLADSGKTVAEIGREVGLENSAYFITLFKKKTGLTPSSYRKLHDNSGT